MKTITELLNTDSPGWPLVLEAQRTARNRIEILPPDAIARTDTLMSLQMTIRSILGAVVYESGGLLVDNRWLRVLGSGHSLLSRNPVTWSFESLRPESGNLPYLLVADDVLGGFFAVDYGALGDPGRVFYFAPDTFKWESLEMGYSDFVLGFCMEQNLDEYYAPYRWDGWQKDIKELSGDEALWTMPPLWLKPAGTLLKKDVWSSRTRTTLAIDRLFELSMDLGRQLENCPDGATVKFSID